MLCETSSMSDRYIGKLIRGADASGYVEASWRLRDLNNETARLLIKAFEFKPKTSRELAVQSAALLVALDIGWTCPAFAESVFKFTRPASRTEAG